MNDPFQIYLSIKVIFPLHYGIKWSALSQGGDSGAGKPSDDRCHYAFPSEYAISVRSASTPFLGPCAPSAPTPLSVTQLVRSPTGHNMSQVDANSVAGESTRAGQTGTGCYKNHEHHMGMVKKEQRPDGVGEKDAAATAAAAGTNILDLPPPNEEPRSGSPDSQVLVSVSSGRCAGWSLRRASAWLPFADVCPAP